MQFRPLQPPSRQFGPPAYMNPPMQQQPAQFQQVQQVQQAQFQPPMQVPPFAPGFTAGLAQQQQQGLAQQQQQGGVSAAGQGVSGAKRKKKKSNARGSQVLQPAVNQTQPGMLQSAQAFVQPGQLLGQGY